MKQTTGSETVEVWYRYEEVRYAAAVDEFGHSHGAGRMELRRIEFNVVKVTPKGVWLRQGAWGSPRFVLRTARKQYASPTNNAALAGFIARKKRQIRILNAQLAAAEKALQIGETLLDNGAKLEKGLAFLDLYFPHG